MTPPIPRDVFLKIRKLASLPEEVRQTEWAVSITRLTVLKSLCRDPEVANRPILGKLLKDFDAPNAKFVLATGCGNPGTEGLGNKVAEAQLALGDEKKHPKFKGTVKALDTRDLWREAVDLPVNQGYHYNHNAETYMESSHRLGWAMANLLKGDRK